MAGLNAEKAPNGEGSRESYAALGLSLYMSRRFAEALAAYDNGLRIAPDDVELRNGRGVAPLGVRAAGCGAADRPGGGVLGVAPPRRGARRFYARAGKRPELSRCTRQSRQRAAQAQSAGRGARRLQIGRATV